MSEINDIFSSDEEDYEPDLDQYSSGRDSVTPKISQSQELESMRKLDIKNEIKNKVPDGIKLFLDLEDKTEEALGTFTNLEDSTYVNKSLGNAGEGSEFMSCECQEEWDGDVNVACCDDDCINRGTKIECVNGISECGMDCSNQRFQKKEYASISVIKTAKKGYGVRTEEDLEPDTFIYEYIGEVVDEKNFKRRMIEYDELNFKHFYFMMLQKGEFIDATRKGSLARFCNHSCNPNCYVEKWVVGKKLRMGIFSKRRILRGEEITFDYNVDRYGANAQPCYCGEPNCIGFIGGKTQTEAASLLPQFIAEALGATIEQEQEYLKLKQEKNEKITKNDNNVNIEYIESLTVNPIEIFEVNKVMGGLLQCEERLIAEKLLERIELSTEEVIQYKLSYAHGYTSLGKLLKMFYSKDASGGHFDIDESLVLRILKILSNWPKVSKNHIEKVEIKPVAEELIQMTENQDIVLLAKSLIERWDSFEEYQKIRKSDKITNKKIIYDERRRNVLEQQTYPSIKQEDVTDSPHDWRSAKSDKVQTYFYNSKTKETSWANPVKQESNRVRDTIKEEGLSEAERREREIYRIKKEHEQREIQRKEYERQKTQQFKREADSLAQIIAEAKQVEKEKLEKEQELKRIKELKKLKRAEYKKKKAAKLQAKKAAALRKSTSASGKTSARSPLPSSTSSSSNAHKWGKFFAQHIPNMVKKYRDEIGHENVKKCAKEISKILIDKEQKKDSKKSPPEDLEREKRKKIKDFVESYMEKFLIKYRSKQAKRKLEDSNNSNGNAHNTQELSKKQHL